MKKKVVLLGGGTGISFFLRGLKDFPIDITAIITEIILYKKNGEVINVNLQDENKLTELQVVQDEMKTMPFGDIWDEYCRQCGVKPDREWFAEIKKYEVEVQNSRKAI